MTSLRAVQSMDDLLPELRGTPIADLFGYHNLRQPYRRHDRAELLIGMCMDNRVMLRIPDNFAFILRAGGANLQRMEFKVSFAVAVGGVRAICLIGHENCGMVNLRERRNVFVTGLVENAGWRREEAEEHFDDFAGTFAIPDAADFVFAEARRLRERYPRVLVAPLYYRIPEGLLYQVEQP